MPSITSYINPFSSQHKALSDSKKLSSGKKTIVWALSILAGILTLPLGGIGGFATFRSLVGRFSKAPPKNQSQTTTTSIKRTAAKSLSPSNPAEGVSIPSPKADRASDDPFDRLKDYISKKYPKFDLSPFDTIRSFQKVGHPFHFAVRQNDLGLMKALIEAGADPDQLDTNGDAALDILMKNYKLGLIQGYPVKRGVPKEDMEMIDFLIEKGSKMREPEGRFDKSSIEYLIGACRSFNRKWITGIINTLANKENIAGIAHAILDNNELPNDLIKPLFAEGLNVDATDREGRSLLYKAVASLDEKLLAFLIKKGAKPGLERSSSAMGAKTPLDLVKAKLKQLKTLESSGAPIKGYTKLSLEIMKCERIIKLIERS